MIPISALDIFKYNLNSLQITELLYISFKIAMIYMPIKQGYSSHINKQHYPDRK